MDWMVLEAVRKGKERREAAIRIRDDDVQRRRLRVCARHVRHVNSLIERLPRVIEGAIAEERYTPRGLVKVERVNIREMKNHDCGLADPREGTYVEYLLRRLRAAGFSPQCEYDDWWGWWYGLMCIDVQPLLSPEVSSTP